MDSTVSQPQKALISGATGFVGHHLARRLADEGWEVHAIVRTTSRVQLPLDPRVKAHVHDGTTDSMIQIVNAVQPHVVFHLASLFLAQHKPEDIANLIQSNILFSTQLAEAMSQAGVHYLINTGTTWQHYQNAQYSPVCLYAATKQAFEAIVQYYVEASGFRVITLQLSDTYGPGDPRPKLLRLLRNTAEAGQSLAMSAGEQMIDLVYIDDVTDAFHKAASRVLTLNASTIETYCVSTGQPMRLRDVVATWSRVTGQPLNIQWGARPYRPREMMTTWCNGLPVPGWTPRTSLEDGFRLITRHI